MRIDVALTPGEARGRDDAVCVVVDVLRASSSIVTLLDRGCREVIPAASVEEARRLAREGRSDGLLLAGEDGSLTPPDFDLGNRPAEIARADLTGRRVVFVSRNGTVVLGKLLGSPAVLIGCLLNADACAGRALELAERSGAAVRIVCAGRDGAFVMDDAVAAGVLVERLAVLAAERDGPAVLGDGARAARRIRESYPDPAAGLRDSASGRLLLRLGLQEDIDYCARTDASRSVPIMVGGERPRITPLDQGSNEGS